MSEQWLMERVPSFRELPAQDRGEIVAFAFLWSLFEARIMDNSATAQTIRLKVDEWQAEGTLEADQYDPDLSYFCNRYFADGSPTHHFGNLHLRARDHPGLVRQVIEGANTDPRDRLLALLMIVWRIRNNLFHGEKWAYGLRDQSGNFHHANAVLMRVLTHHAEM